MVLPRVSIHGVYFPWHTVRNYIMYKTGCRELSVLGGVRQKQIKSVGRSDTLKKTNPRQRRVKPTSSRQARGQILDTLLDINEPRKGGNFYFSRREISLKNVPGVTIEDKRSPQDVRRSQNVSISLAINARIKQGKPESPTIKHFDVNDKELLKQLYNMKYFKSVRDVEVQVPAKIVDDVPLSFSELGIHHKLVSNLARQNIVVPNEIQSLAIKAFRSNADLVVHGETGSGKTLAYLLPILENPGPAAGSVILVPSRELALQVYNVAINLLSKQSIVQVAVSGNEDNAALLEKFRNLKPRILIGTPKAIYEIICQNEEKFVNVQRVVMDEVDRTILFGKKRKKKSKYVQDPHIKAFEQVLSVLQAINKGKPQFIACTATVDSNLLGRLHELGWSPDMKVVKSSSLIGQPHQLPKCLEHNCFFYSPKQGMKKAPSVARVFRALECRSALVFIKSGNSPNNFVDELTSCGINAVPLHAELSAATEKRQSFLRAFNNGEIDIAVATEDIVRGLDIKDLDHVILTEVPLSSGEYVHLAGRAGRQGRPGYVTTLISDQVHEERSRYSSISEELNFRVSLLEETRRS